VDVLSRGYGRIGTGVERVDPEAADAARRFGDEPVLLARRLGLPVWVGSDRFAAGEAAERGGVGEQVALPNDQRRVHLLDDGFQHRRLSRAVDVLLLTEEDFDDALLPAGNRRERLTALRRADVVVLRDEERARLEAQVRALMSQSAVVWSVRRELRFPDLASGPATGSSLLGFCAIARPDGFWTMLAEAGCKLVERVEFEDHHAYEAADVERLVKVAKGCGATGFVTTEKDAVKLSSAMLGWLRSVGPVCVAGLDAKFVEENEVMLDLEARLR
jgi:tetraacyldisaccharide 4'-kinase